MAEYIERMSAIATACKGCNKEFSNEPCEPSECYIQQGLFTIPATDVVEVVRCKDCKHYVTAPYYALRCEQPKDTKICRHPGLDFDTECGDHWISMNPDGFCSYGERREGE